ncbi:MAG: glucose-6-phosphate isomerase [Spirochaetales bacterium]|jgi:glucose-6-phosphate isomerase|nr:glucose-6-phosphate isomerase [Spirochaetales bacterium]
MGNLEFKNLDETQAYANLAENSKELDLDELLDPQRIDNYSISVGGGLIFNYGARAVDGQTIGLLTDLAREQQVIEKYQALASGAVMNTGEGRMVLHHLTRGQIGEPVLSNGKNLRKFYIEQRNRFSEFAEEVHGGRITGSTGKPFDTVVQIGIGGSDLGPRALYLALKNLAIEQGNEKMRALFISNVDPDDANSVLSRIDLEKTLFILVSKSGTTQETLTNRDMVYAKMRKSGISGLEPESHFVAVTSESSPLAHDKNLLDSFFIDDYIGGRYSSTSAVGGVVLSLAFGPDYFGKILEGAHEADFLALEENPRTNAGLMDALIGLYERNIVGIPCTAILPYSQALERFPAHLQQLDMESNGKSVSRDNQPVSYSTGPVLFGEPGTNGQHSFYQLLHQGTDKFSLQFIGFLKAQTGFDIIADGSTSQKKLQANLAAQIAAFALGKSDTNKSKNFSGNRFSSLIYGQRLTPRSLGALLAHYENKVMFQGFLWNLNSFDQEGVQLGKVLAKQVLTGKMEDPVLAKYAAILGII